MVGPKSVKRKKRFKLWSGPRKINDGCETAMGICKSFYPSRLSDQQGHRRMSSHATPIPDGLDGKGGIIGITYSDEAISKGRNTKSSG